MNSESRIKARLKSAGIRPTGARCSILQFFSENELHPTADELKTGLLKRGASIPVATLYQNLERLTGAGLLIKFSGLSGETRYDGNTEHHHHLICTSCNIVLDVTVHTPLSDYTITGDTTMEAVSGWEIGSARIEFLGTCPGCSATLSRRKTTSTK